MVGEVQRRAASGWGMLVGLLVATVGDGYLIFRLIRELIIVRIEPTPVEAIWGLVAAGLALADRKSVV